MFEKLFSQSGLSLDRLRSLVEVDEAGGIAGAAPGDPVRQSQISRNLSQLEAFFSTELKRRKGKGIELTSAGKRLATLARSHILSLEAFAMEATDGASEIRIGGGQSTLEWVILPILSDQSVKHEQLRFVLKSMRSQEVVSALNDFSLDVGVVRRSAITSKRIVTRPITTIRYSLFVRKSRAEKFEGNIHSILGGIPLATSMGGEYRTKFKEFVRENEIEPDLRYSCSSFRTALEILKRDPAVGALLPNMAASELGEKEFSSIPLPFLSQYEREIVFAWNERIGDIRPQTERVIQEFAGIPLTI